MMYANANRARRSAFRARFSRSRSRGSIQTEVHGEHRSGQRGTRAAEQRNASF